MHHPRRRRETFARCAERVLGPEAMQQRSERPKVDVPDRASDRPVWAKVGIIAVVGFLIGIAWPRLAGLQLGPTPPEGDKAHEPVASSQPAAPPASVVAAGSGSAPAGPQPVTVQTVVVKKTDVLSCRDNENKIKEQCDRPGLDALLMPRLKNLEKCPSAAGLAGKLSIGFDIDFRRDRVRVLQGKSTTIPQSTVAGIWRCADEEIKGARLAGLQHDNMRYTLFYSAYFYPPGKIVDPEMKDDEPERDTRDGVKEGERDDTAEALGTAQVVYDTVLVRDEPKTGKVVGRLVRGTKVDLLSKKGSWYKIRFQDKEGWVYRGAIAQ